MFHNLSAREEELLDLIDLLIDRLSIVDGAREVANEKFRVIHDRISEIDDLNFRAGQSYI